MNHYIHFDFTDGSNPYLLKTSHPDVFKNLFSWLTAFDFELVPAYDNFCCNAVLTENRINRRNYSEVKNRIRDFAIQWQSITSEITADYEYFMFWGAFFRTYGARYGLLTEFRENCII